MTALVGVGAPSEGSNADRTPGLPAGLAAGDVLLCYAAIRNSGTGVPDTPAGYTLLLNMGNARIFGKIAGGSEVAPTITFTGGVVGATNHASMAAFRGPSALTVVDTSTQLNASGQDIAYPAGPALAGTQRALLIWAGWKQDDWTSTSPPGNLLASVSTTTGDDAGIVWSYQVANDTSTAGTITVTGGAAAISRGGVLALDAEPAVTATLQDVWPPRVQVAVTGLAVGDSITLYRVVAGARTAVRAGADPAVIDAAFIRIDAELPFGVPVSYLAVVNSGTEEYTTSPVTYTLDGGKAAVTDAIGGLSAETVIRAWPDRQYSRKSAVFQVGGANIVVAGPLTQPESDIEFLTESTTARDSLMEVLAGATEGIVQIRQAGGYDGVDCYVVPLTVTERRFSQDGSDQRRLIAARVVETDSWAEELEASGYTLGDIAAAYDGLTLADIANDYGTLLDIALGSFDS